MSDPNGAARLEALTAEWAPEERGALRALAAELSSIDTGYILTTARKATCLIDIVVRAGLLRPKVPIMSDRILDMNTDHIIGQNVTIVDDVIISGSSLYKLQRKIQKLDANPKLLAMAVDNEWWNSSLCRPRQPYLQLSHEQIIALSHRIVNLISTWPRPYNIDWPLFSASVARRDVDLLTSMTGWTYGSVTTHLQQQRQISSLSFQPCSNLTKMLNDSLGYPVDNFAHMKKVRVITAEMPRGTLVRVCPIVIFDIIHERDLRSMFEVCLDSMPETSRESVADTVTSDDAKLRFLQYAVSARLGRLWMENFSSLVDNRSCRWSIEKRDIEYVFAPKSVSAVEELALSYAPILQGYRASNKVEPTRLPQHLRPQQLLPKVQDDKQMLQTQLAHPFVMMYKNREVVARDLLYELGPRAFSDPQYKKITDRLDSGITVEQLLLLAEQSNPSTPKDVLGNLVSQFLDFAVDAGIAVPVTTQHRGSYVRAFRHGEDVTFAETEHVLCQLMLKNFFAGYERNQVNRIVFEKIFVAMLRTGLQGGHLQPWQGVLGAEGSVGIRFRRHGAVATVSARDHFDNTQGQAISVILRNIGVIAQSRSRQYVLGDYEPEAPITRPQTRWVSTFGLIMGELLRPGNNSAAEDPDSSIMTTAELTMLTSCSRKPDVVKALAAEVHISRPLCGKLADHVAKAPYANKYGFYKSNFSGNSPFAKALDSGRQKLLHVRSGETQQIINRVSGSLPDLYMRAKWEEIADSFIDGDSVADTSADNLVERLGIWILELRLTAMIGELWCRREAFQLRGKPLNGRPAMADIDIALDEIHRVSPNRSLWNSVWKVDKAGNNWDSWMQNIDLPNAVRTRSLLLSSAANELIDEACARSGPDGNLRQIQTYECFVCAVPTGAALTSANGLDDIRFVLEKSMREAREVMSEMKMRTSHGSVMPPEFTPGCGIAAFGGTVRFEFAALTMWRAIQSNLMPTDVRFAVLLADGRDSRVLRGLRSQELYGTVFTKRIAYLKQLATAQPNVTDIGLLNGERSSVDVQAVLTKLSARIENFHYSEGLAG